MRKTIYRCLPLALFGGLFACAPASSADQDVMNATPSYDTLALDMEDSDVAKPQALTREDCHPHLFQRSREVVALLNHHILRAFGRADAIIDAHPKLKVGSNHTWERDLLGISVKVEVNKTAAGQFSYTTSIKAVMDPDSAYVVVAQGTISKTDGTPHTGSGTMHFDLSALGSVIKDTDGAEGTIDVNFTVDGKTKKLVVQVSGFKPAGDPRPPRSANYVFERTKAVGGSIKFTEDVELLCPANPTHQIATIDAVARWNRSNGKFTVRADAIGTGGQIPSGDKWIGLTCADASMGDRELYWQMKLENSSGMVVRDQDLFFANDMADPSTTCDPAFGAVPALDSNANDYDFTSINFMNDSAVAYPGQP